MFEACGTIIIITTFHPSSSDSILVGTAEVKLFSYVCILAFLVHEGRYHRVILNKTEPLFCCFLRFVFKLFTKSINITSLNYTVKLFLGNNLYCNQAGRLTKVREQNNSLCICVAEM